MKFMQSTLAVLVWTGAAGLADADPATPSDAGAACDQAAHMPASALTTMPDHGFLQGVRVTDAALQAVVDACSKAAAADPKEGRYEHRLGVALRELKRPAEAVAALEKAKALGFPGGFDELSDARFHGTLAPALPLSLEDGIKTADAGIAATGNPEIARGLAAFLENAAPPLQDKARARKLLEDGVAAHHLPSMVDLGALLMREPSPTDKGRGRKMLDGAIAEGSPYAALTLGTMAYSGDGMPKDIPQARMLFQKAAEQGDSLSMVNLAIMSGNGDGGPVDVERERVWLGKAQALGNVEAVRRLGDSLLYETPKNPGDGLKDLIAASDAGSREATYELGDLYRNGDDVAADPVRALGYYRKAFAAGDGRAATQIGGMYDYGEGVPVDHAEARGWYEKGAAGGDASAYSQIGMQYDHEMGVPRDVVKALEWYHKGAEKGSSVAMSNMGYAYENGRGIKRDYAEAVKWYDKAVALDDATAEHNLANMYLDGEGIPKNQARGLELMQRSADQGLPMALNDMALIEHKRGHTAAAMKLLHQAAAHKTSEAYLNLAQAFAMGWSGEPDFVQANYWYAKAVDNPSDLNPLARSEAQFHLGQNLLEGNGIPQDRRRGIVLMRQALAAGNPTARAFVGSKRARGDGLPGGQLR